jgi:hypothetical protein
MKRESVGKGASDDTEPPEREAKRDRSSSVFLGRAVERIDESAQADAADKDHAD